MVLARGVEDCLFICLSIEALWHLRSQRPTVACVYALDLIEADLPLDREILTPRADDCNMDAYIVAYEDLLRDHFAFASAIREIVKRAHALYPFRRYLVFEYHPDTGPDYDVDTELPLGVHAIIRHFLAAETGARVEVIPLVSPQRALRTHLPRFLKEVARVVSITVLRLIHWIALIILKICLRGKAASVYLLFGTEINLIYCKRLAASVSDTGVTVYVSRYDNMLAWLGDVRRHKVFILPITFPVSKALWVLSNRRAIAEFKRRFLAHLAASPSEFLQRPAVGDRMVAGLYGKYVYTLMFEQLATVVQYLKCGVQLCAFEAGQCAGFYYLISHLLKSRAEQYIEFINVWFHGSSDRAFRSTVVRDAWIHPKIRFFIRNRIELDSLRETGVPSAQIYHMQYDPVLVHDATPWQTNCFKEEADHQREGIAKKFGLRPGTKKVLILTAGGGWLRCGINLRKAHEVLYEFLIKCGEDPGVEILLKTHPRRDFYRLYLEWARVIPNLVVVMQRENVPHVSGALPRVRFVDGNSLDELLGISDVVVSGPIFNSAVLKAAWYGHDVIFPMDGVYGNGFISANFENYFVCTRTPELLQRCVDQSPRVRSSRSSEGWRRLYDLSDVKAQEF